MVNNPLIQPRSLASQRKAPLWAGLKADKVRHLKSPVSPSSPMPAPPFGSGGTVIVRPLAMFFLSSCAEFMEPAPRRRIFHAREMKPPGGSITGRGAGGCDEPASHATAYRSRSAIVVLQWLWK